MRLGHPTPILRMFDERMTREFYVDFLGFKVDWEHRFDENGPLYMQVSHGDCVMQISGHFGDGCPGAAVSISVDDIDRYQQGLLAKNYKHARPGAAELKPWGALELTVTDPSGNHLTLTQDVRK